MYKVPTEVQVRRRIAVSARGRFNAVAVAEMELRLERVCNTTVQTYDVYNATERLPAGVIFRLETDATEAQLKEAIANVEHVESVQAEEIDAVQKN